MATVTASECLAAPVEEVFAQFTDLEHGAAGHVSGIVTFASPRHAARRLHLRAAFAYNATWRLRI